MIKLFSQQAQQQQQQLLGRLVPII